MVAKFSRPSSINELEMELIDTGKKLLLLPPPSTAHINNLFSKMKQILSKVGQNPSESMKRALYPITMALIAKQLLKHPDINVNISVACCFCEILRINAPDPPYKYEQLKDLFEMIILTFENLSSVSGGCYTVMARVLKLFNRYKLATLMWDLGSVSHGLFVRLFKQFLTVADSNSSEIVLKMEETMTMIIEESDEFQHELVGLLVTFLKNNNPVVSPVCWQLGEKVLMNFGARSKPHIPDMRPEMSIALYDYSRLVACICKAASENDIMVGEETKIKIECVKTLRRCQHDEKNSSFYDPLKSVTEVNGKRQRIDSPLGKQTNDAAHATDEREVGEAQAQDRDHVISAQSQNPGEALNRPRRNSKIPFRYLDYYLSTHICI